MEINSKKYWDYRFSENWESACGPSQTKFFGEVMLRALPEWLVKDIKLNASTVCDAGCAQGDLLPILKRVLPNTEVVGFDFSSEAVSTARARYPKFHIWEDDIQQFDNGFDVIICSNVLEHFDYPEAPMANISRNTRQHLILVLPFEEVERVEEHMVTFEYGNLPFKLGELSLSFFREVDCRDIPNSQWLAKQIVLVYSSESALSRLNLTIQTLLTDVRKQLEDAADTIALERGKVSVLQREKIQLEDHLKILRTDNTVQSQSVLKLTDQLQHYIDRDIEKNASLQSAKLEIERLERVLEESRATELNDLNVALTIQLDELKGEHARLVTQAYESAETLRRLTTDILAIVNKMGSLRSVKVVNLIRRFWLQLIRGRMEIKKSFLVWIWRKITHKNLHGIPSIGLLDHLVSVVEQVSKPMSRPQSSLNKIRGNSKSGGFFDIYEARYDYYRTAVQSFHESPETSELRRILERPSRGIVVYPAAVKWEPRQRPQHILQQFAERGYTCIFCTDSAADSPFTIQECEPNLFVVNKEEYLLPLLQSKFIIVLCTWLVQMAWINNVPNKLLWYDLIDRPDFFDLFDEDTAQMHTEVIGAADFVSYSAQNLAEFVVPRNDAVYMPNGVNPSDFSPADDDDVPNELERIVALNKPIIGYYGAIEEWFDTCLVSSLAKKNPDWEFVIIGKSGIDISNLYEIPNIHFIGPKSYTLLYRYSRLFDVALIPFIVNDLTNSVSPVKFFEYVAMGIPTVSTPINEMLQFREVGVLLAESVEEFENRIDLILRGKWRPDVSAVLTGNTWSDRVDHFEHYLASDAELWKVYANIDSGNSVNVLTATFFDFDGSNFYSGGAERYLVDLHSLCESLGTNLTIYQYGNSQWVRRYKGISVISLAKKGVDAHNLTPAALYEFNKSFFYQAMAGSILNIYSAFFEASPLCANPSIGISHGVSWDTPSSNYSDGMQFWGNNKRYIDAARLCSELVSVDTNTANWYQTVDYAVSQKIHVIPNYVDLETFHPREDYARPSEKLRIIYPRRLYAARGLYLVLDIIDDILEQYPNVEFHFIGKGFEQDTIFVEDKIRRWEERVQWYHLDPDDMYRAYRDADIALIPTLHSEGTSLSCLEAMASGNVVVATRVGGLTDLVIDGYNGYLIDPNTDALREAIVSLITDSRRLSEFKRRSVEVAESFSKSTWKKKWTDVLAPHLQHSVTTISTKWLGFYLNDLNDLQIEVIDAIVKVLSKGHFAVISIANSNETLPASYGRLQWTYWDTKYSDIDAAIFAPRVTNEELRIPNEKILGLTSIDSFI